MIVFRKARNPQQTLNDLDAYLRTVGDKPVRWLAREVQSWGEFSYDEIAALIESGQLDALIDWQERWAGVVNQTLAPMWLKAIEEASRKATKGMTVLSDSNDYVKAWVSSHGGELITLLSDESRKAISNILLRGQGLRMAPRDIAKDIRPLIGLTDRQAQANLKYKNVVYQKLLDNGMSEAKARERSEAAALKYAGKQHRYRAESIVLTENAFAYNRGAHMGVSQSIADGYMGRCEMVWTTAGTNRVCGRCMELKDTVVGYTDQSGVTIPPLHPRCRCAIMYREVGTPRVMQPKPQIVTVQYEDVARIHSHEELLKFANQIKPTIEQYTGRQSKWNGKIILQDEGEASGGKLWDCSIRLNPDAPEHALIHELVHSCSISHYNLLMFLANRFEEELTVEYLSQELAILENAPVVNSGYTAGVELIRELKVALGISVSDLEFASELIKQPLGERWDWLWEQISDKINSETPIEFGQGLMNKLERIRNWKTKKSTE